MKSLLIGINAKYIHSNLAIQCLRAYVEEYSDAKVEVREFTINMQVEDIIRGIYDEAPDLIGISTYIWNVDIVMQVIKDLKILLPDTLIYLGGPEVSFRSSELIYANPEIDGIMMGEGEQTFLELINHYETGTPALIDIKGLCFKSAEGNVIANAARPPIDLSTVPFPYESLVDFENKIIYYETSRGCPFGCSYCLSSVDKTVRFRDMELVKKELLFFMSHKVPQVKLVDRTFNIDHRRSIEMLKFLKENDNGITNFHFEIAGDILTSEEVALINSLRPGLIQLEIGVQSTNTETLKCINRHTDLDKLRTNVKLLLEGGRVHLHLDLIAGLPYEDLSSFKKSFNEVYSMGSHELQLGFLKLLKGAPIYSIIDEQKIKHSSHAPYEVLSTGYLSYGDIRELKLVEEMLEIYHNSCQFIRSEKFLLTREISAYDMYLSLAEYYIKKEQLIIQCKRSVRYEILLDYAVSKFNLSDDKKEQLRNLLVLDYYSREKAKARPTFAPDIDAHKRDIREINNSLLASNPSGSFHAEPLYGKNKYIIFDYTKRSPITGNAFEQIYK